MRIFDRSRVESFCGPTTVYQIIAQILPWVIFLVTVIVLIAGWGRIPEQIPMKTDFRGNVTDWEDKRSLIWLGVIYLIINLTLWITEYFPGTWNNGVHIGFSRMNKQNSSVHTYRLTRDFLCDLRISMSVLFSLSLLWSAFGSAGYLGSVLGITVPALILIPLARYLLRLYVFR